MGIYIQSLNENTSYLKIVYSAVAPTWNRFYRAEKKSIWMDKIHGKSISQVLMQFMAAVVDRGRELQKFLKRVGTPKNV